MNSKVILVVGQKHAGKTTLVRSMVKPVHPSNLILFDPNGQYSDIYKKPFMKFNEFTEFAATVWNAVIVIEESTVYISHAPMMDVKDFCAGARNRSNMVILVFHSLRTLPRYVYDLAEIIYLGKTRDDADYISKKNDDPGLTETFLEVKNSKWKNGDDGDQYSEFKIHEI